MPAPHAIPDEDHLTQVGRVLIDHFNAIVVHYQAADDKSGFPQDLHNMFHEAACLLGIMLAKTSGEPERAVDAFADTMMDAVQEHHLRQLQRAGIEVVTFPAMEDMPRPTHD